MRHAHPNLFLGMLACGGYAILNGVSLVATTPRMPDWMPSTPVGIAFAVAGVFMLFSAFDLAVVNLGKFGLAISIVTSFAMAVGLYIGYGSVTASIDRPNGYLFVAFMQLAPLREPPLNPVTRSRR